jgi:hypothetical protein
MTEFYNRRQEVCAMAISFRSLMLLEAVTFFAAAAIHSGLLVEGYQHREARIAETVIGIVLLAGAIMASFGPLWARRAGLAAQTFALVGTIIGIVTIAIGVGPRSFADVMYHAIIVCVLIYGVSLAVRARRVKIGSDR